MQVTKSVLNIIRRGLEGKNIGLPSGLPLLDKYTYGIQKSFIYLIGADTGAGKTSLAINYLYAMLIDIFKRIDQWEANGKIGNKPGLEVKFFTLEMSAEVLMVKLLSQYIYDKYSVIIPIKEIFSFEKPLESKKIEVINDCKLWMKRVEEHVHFITTRVGWKELDQQLKEMFSKHGAFYQDKEGNEVYVIDKNKEDYTFSCFVDHIGLLAGSKEDKDKCSDILIKYRDMCTLTSFAVQQLNRNFKSNSRRETNFRYIQIDDFKGTSSFSDAANIIIGIFFAYREKDLNCLGYRVDILETRFRMIQLLKHRFGDGDFNIGCCFYGEVGKWIELPEDPNQIMFPESYKDLPTDDNWYENFKKLKNELQIQVETK